MRRLHLNAIVALMAAIMGCQTKTETVPQPTTTKASPAQPAAITPPNATAAKPEPVQPEIKYEIISESSLSDIKTSVDIRLKETISKDTLRQIATQLRLNNRQHFKRLFIGYYLPGMKVDEGAWATTHFDPNLNVRVIGASLAASQALNEIEQNDPNRVGQVVGRWSWHFIGATYVITREGTNLFVDVYHKDGSHKHERLIEKIIRGEKRLIGVNDKHDEYLVIRKDGRLALCGKSGVFEILPLK